MKRNLITILALGAAGLLLGACAEDPITSPTAAFSPTLSMFPGSVGSTWTYKVTDSIAATERSVTVTVDTQTVSGTYGAAYRWLVQDGGTIDTVAATIDFDTLRIVPQQVEPIPLEMRYDFPFQPGDRWPGLSDSDTVRVLERGPLDMATIDFDGAFRIERTVNIPNSALVVTHWFVPNIGLAQMSVLEFSSWGDRNETWELASYRIQ